MRNGAATVFLVLSTALAGCAQGSAGIGAGTLSSSVRTNAGDSTPRATSGEGPGGAGGVGTRATSGTATGAPGAAIPAAPAPSR